MARKLNAKAFAQHKRTRRKWLTFVRMCRYGINNFSRNAWLTVAATAVMTITLLSIFMTFVARDVLLNTVNDVQKQVGLSLYVQTETPSSAVSAIAQELKRLKTVTSVDYISPEQARDDFAKAQKGDEKILNAINQATNHFSGTFRVQLVDINNTSQLEHFAKTNSTYQEYQDPDHPPSFSGGGKKTISTIGSWVLIAERIGYVLSVVFIALSSLIIFNTIRMAIFNRKEEIQMMKLIGADRSFIRGPFIVEAVVYGFIAAIVATAIGIGIMFGLRKGLVQFGADVDRTITFILSNIGLVALAMIILGAIIGIMSSWLATRRYLKI